MVTWDVCIFKELYIEIFRGETSWWCQLTWQILKQTKKGINKYWEKAKKAKKQISIVNPAGWQTGVQCTISTLPYFEISTVKSWHNYSENK